MSRHAGPALTIRAKQREALFKLQQAIIRAEHAPCIGSTKWISELDADQEKAAELCAACPVIDACRNYITRWPREFGVYAGTSFNERNSK